MKFLATTISGGYLVLELRLAKPNIPVVPLRENLDENVLKGELVGRGDQIIGFNFRKFLVELEFKLPSLKSHFRHVKC